MSNYEVGLERRKPSRKIIRAALALLALGSCVKLTPKALDELFILTTDPSDIVSGVPGQIETYNTNSTFNGKFWVNNYWLGIEQCPADIVNAKRDSFTESYDLGVGVVSPSCNFDWVKVDPSTFSSVTIGDPITFEGSVGERLRK